MEEIEFSRWLFEGRLRQGKNVLLDGLNWLCYFAGSSKSHRENSISCIFLEFPHQVDMKNVVKSSTFLGISILQKLTVKCYSKQFLKFKQFKNSKLPSQTQTSPNQPNSQILLHNKRPMQVFVRMSLELTIKMNLGSMWVQSTTSHLQIDSFSTL